MQALEVSDTSALMLRTEVQLWFQDRPQELEMFALNKNKRMQESDLFEEEELETRHRIALELLEVYTMHLVEQMQPRLGRKLEHLMPSVDLVLWKIPLLQRLDEMVSTTYPSNPELLLTHKH